MIGRGRLGLGLGLALGGLGAIDPRRQLTPEQAIDFFRMRTGPRQQKPERTRAQQNRIRRSRRREALARISRRKNRRRK